MLEWKVITMFKTSLQNAPQSPYSDDEMLQKNRDCVLYKNKILIDMNKQDVKDDLMFLGKLSDYANKHLNVKLNMRKLK